MKFDKKTIVALATARVASGIAVIRISGSLSLSIALAITNCKEFKARHAHFIQLLSKGQKVIDDGIAIFFPSPNSFTGEDVVELHCHGSIPVIDALISRCCDLGAVPAAPGEFSERSFLNGKMDLTQAESIQSLIKAQSLSQAHSAYKSMQGNYAEKIRFIRDKFINLRVLVESALDFSSEDIEIISYEEISLKIDVVSHLLEELLQMTKEAIILKSNLKIAILGLPNAGKSSLFNGLIGDEHAIVTEMAGTTRDLLHQRFEINRFIFELVDSAGIRNNSTDIIENQGILRAKHLASKVDLILWVHDWPQNPDINNIKRDILNSIEGSGALKRIIVIANKIDKLADDQLQSSDIANSKTIGLKVGKEEKNYEAPVVFMSSQSSDSLALLKKMISNISSFHHEFSAEPRHEQGLILAKNSLFNAKENVDKKQSMELISEDLLSAQNSLSEIIGEIYTEDLLGDIFGKFCVGK